MAPDMNADLQAVASLGPNHVVLLRKFVFQKAERVSEVRAQLGHAVDRQPDILAAREYLQHAAAGVVRFGFGFKGTGERETELVEQRGRENVPLLKGRK